MIKHALILVCCIILCGLSGGVANARFSLKNNMSPTKGMLGVNVGVLKPFGGDGQLFASDDDTPHGDYGFSAGLDYWKKNLNSFEYHLGFKAKFVQYHFHHTPEGGTELTGHFQMLYYSVPLSLHLSIPNYPYLQAVGGIAITSMNVLGVKSGATDSFTYNSTLDLKWVVAPEIFLGINFIEEKTDFMFFKGAIVISTFPMRNLSHRVSLGNGIQEFNAASSMPSGKIELVLTFYPKWKTKRSISNDEGINCPTSF